MLHSPFLSDAAFKSLALCRRLHKIRIEGEDINNIDIIIEKNYFKLGSPKFNLIFTVIEQ